MSKHNTLFGRPGWCAMLGESGSAMIEFALLAPFLLILMAGAYDFGRALYEQYRLTAAANAGAQYAFYQLAPPQNGTAGWTTISSEIATIVQQYANNSSISVTPTQCGCPTTTGVCGTATSGGVCAVGEGSGANAPTSNSYVVVQATESFSTLINYPFITYTNSSTSTITLTGQSIVQVF